MTSFADPIYFEPAIFEVRSHDIDTINNLLRSIHWQPDLIQLKPGLLDFQYLIANLGGIQFARVSVNLGMIHRSSSPHHTITFGFSLDPQFELNWCGHSVSPQQIIVHQSNRETNLSSKTPKDFAAITLDVKDFLNSGMHEDQALFEQLLSEKIHLLSVNQIAALRLRNDLKQIFALIQNQPNTAIHPVMQRIIRNDFLPLLLACLHSSKVVPESGISHRYKVIKEVEAYIMTCINRPLTLQDLCTAAGCQSRTLQLAFLEVFGISPMAYLKIHRLHGVRQQLQRANPQAITVMGTALRWGFSHMGYFSRDYKLIFGETPSQTLRRARS